MDDLDRHLERAMKDPGFRREYERWGPLFEAMGASINRRHELGLTQAELAARMGRKQPAIARFEAGNSENPSLTFLLDLAEALDMKLSLRFEPKEQPDEMESSSAKREATTKAGPAPPSRTKRTATAASR